MRARIGELGWGRAHRIEDLLGHLAMRTKRMFGPRINLLIGRIGTGVPKDIVDLQDEDGR